MSELSFDVAMPDEGWSSLGIDISALAHEAARALPDDIIPQEPQEVSLVLMNDASIQGLNREYRNKDKPTNVLSFPTVNAPMMLGDIVLGRETITAEAQAASQPLADHLSHLIIHGLLHLLGYDHIDSRDADAMEAIEIKALAKLGIANPYVLKA